MDDLITWLLEQIAEDERIARAAVLNWASATGAFGYLEEEVGVHVEAWQPERTLAECEAKRRRIAKHQAATEPVGPSGQQWCETCVIWGRPGLGKLEAAPVPYPCPTLRSEVLPYLGRPGYQESWRPA